MDFSQLQYILSLNEKKSLAAVAEEFYTSHQSVKNSIKYLEDELGIPLIVSTKQGSELTEAGKCLCRYGLKFNALYSEMKQEIDLFKKSDITSKDILNLYMAPMFATELYQSFFDEFEKTNNILLSLNIYSAETIIENICDMENSVGIFPMNLNREHLDTLKKNIKKRNMKLELISEIQNYAVVYKNSKFAKRDYIVLDNIDQTPLFTFLNTNIFCGSKRIDNNIQYFSDFNLLKKLLKKTNGIGIVKKVEYDYYFGMKNSNYYLVPIKNVAINYVAIYNNADKNNQNIKVFIKELKRHVE